MQLVMDGQHTEKANIFSNKLKTKHMDNLNLVQQCCKRFFKRQCSALLLGCIAFTQSAFAGENDTTFVRRDDGKIIPAPTWDSPEAAFITPRKHPDNKLSSGQGTRVVNPAARYTPHTGSPRILVILASFKDKKISVEQPKDAFYDFFNATGKPQNRGNGNHRNFSSVAQYFKASSNGAFIPIFDIYGPVELPHNMAYYGGTNPDDNSDERPEELTRDAFELVKSQITNVNQYDSNHDGYFDCVYVVYAGLGQNNGGVGENVWACASYMTGTAPELNGKRVFRYSIGAELFPRIADRHTGKPQINSIGVTCHEFSHTMGLPDIYPTTSSAQVHNQEMEFWDLMDGGEYAGNGGFIPMPYTAWERKQMGWPLNIQPLQTDRQAITMDKTLNEGGTAYQIVNPNDSREYFLMENIKKENWYSGLPAVGLLVYRITDVDNLDFYYHPNNVPNKPTIAVVPADGLLFSSYLQPATNGQQVYMNQMKGDLFAGPNNVDKLNDDLNLPNFWWYTAGSTTERSEANANYYKVNQGLDHIQRDAAGTITFTYYADIKNNPPSAIHHVSGEFKYDNRIYTINGQYVGTSKEHLPAGVYIINHKKIVIK